MQCSKTEQHVFYPEIKKNIVTENFFGKQIKDSYRNIENLNDSIVLTWLKSQGEKSKTILDKITEKAHLINLIRARNKEYVFTISNLKVTDNNSHFYLKKYANDDVAKLFFRNGFNEKEILLYNPLSFKSATNHHLYSINYIQPNWDATKIVIGLTKNDEEFSILKILDVSSKKLLPDEAKNSLPNSLGGVEWLPDNSGFIYTYVPVIDSKQKQYLYNSRAVIYKIGQRSKKMITIFSKQTNPNINFKKESFPLIYLTNRKNIIILGANATGTSLYRDTYYSLTTDLAKGKVNWKLLFKKEDKITSFVLEKNHLYYISSKDAPNFKIRKTFLKNTHFKNPEILIEEDSVSVITDFALTSKGLFYVKTKNGVKAKLYFLNKINTSIEEIKLPIFSGNINVKSKGFEYEDLWIETEGWTTKKARYKYNYKSKLFENNSLSITQKHTKLEDVIIEEIEIKSHDSVKIPLSIIYKKGTKKNGNNRLLINGYGAYGWSNSPNLHPYLLHWVNMGGIYAVAHVRGGGENGDTWHKAGFKTTKPNTWKDLIACTEYFIKKKYTTNDKIAVWGASAGGICVGRAITERPDLYAAAIIRVGILNTLRREFGTNGKYNTKEYGTINNSIEFEALYEMDAYHHIKNRVNYPAVYLTAGINDSRVPAWQPAKFAARLQEASISNKPILLSVDFKGGHGFEATQTKRNEELANILSFALWQTGHPDYQPK